MLHFFLSRAGELNVDFSRWSRLSRFWRKNSRSPLEIRDLEVNFSFSSRLNEILQTDSLLKSQNFEREKIYFLSLLRLVASILPVILVRLLPRGWYWEGHKGRGSVRFKPVSMIYAPNRFDAKPVSSKTGLDLNRFRIIRHYSKTKFSFLSKYKNGHSSSHRASQKLSMARFGSKSRGISFLDDCRYARTYANIDRNTQIYANILYV